MMKSRACLVSPRSLGGRYLLYPLSSIRQTIVFSPWSWWVINSRVQDPQCPILNHLFIRFWPICNSGKKLRSAIICGVMPPWLATGRAWPGSWQSLEEDRSESWLGAGGWGRCHVNWFNANKDSHHHDQSHPEPSGVRSQRSWHLHKRLSQDLEIHLQTCRVSGHNADGRCRFRSG